MLIIYQNKDMSIDMGKLYAYNFMTDTFRRNTIPSYYSDLFGDKVLTVDIGKKTGDIALAIDRGVNWRLIVLKYIKSNNSQGNTGELFLSSGSSIESRFSDDSDSIFEPIRNKIMNQAKVFLDYYVSHAMRCEKLWSMLTVDKSTTNEQKYIKKKEAEVKSALDNINGILEKIENLYSKQSK